MIAEDGDDRNPNNLLQVAGQRTRFFHQAVVGEIAANQQHVCGFGNLGQQRLSGPLRCLGVMQIGQGRHSKCLLRQAGIGRGCFIHGH